MNKQQFLDLGLTEDQAVKAEAESKKELETYVPKHRFDEVNKENKTLKDTVKENTNQLETLKKSTGDDVDLKNQIQKLQDDNKLANDKYEADLKDLKISNAIKLAISDKAQDADLVAGLFDKTKLILGDDGKITGLDEQVKTLKEGKPFLFKAETTETNKQNQFKGMAPGDSNTNSLDPNIQTGTPSIKNALTAIFQNNNKE